MNIFPSTGTMKVGLYFTKAILEAQSLKRKVRFIGSTSGVP